MTNISWYAKICESTTYHRFCVRRSLCEWISSEQANTVGEIYFEYCIPTIVDVHSPIHHHLQLSLITVLLDIQIPWMRLCFLQLSLITVLIERSNTVTVVAISSTFFNLQFLQPLCTILSIIIFNFLTVKYRRGYYAFYYFRWLQCYWTYFGILL